MLNIILDINKLIEFLERRKKPDFSKLTEALNCKYITGVSRKYLKEELANQHFKSATGVFLYKELREAMIEVHENNKRELPFSHFKRAQEYLYLEDSKLSIKIPYSDKTSYKIMKIFSLFLFIIGVISLIFLVSLIPGTIKVTQEQIIIVFLGMFFSFILSILMVFQTFPVYSALKIKKILDNPKTVTK